MPLLLGACTAPEGVAGDQPVVVDAAEVMGATGGLPVVDLRQRDRIYLFDRSQVVIDFRLVQLIEPDGTETTLAGWVEVQRGEVGVDVTGGPGEVFALGGDEPLVAEVVAAQRGGLCDTGCAACTDGVAACFSDCGAWTPAAPGGGGSITEAGGSSSEPHDVFYYLRSYREAGPFDPYPRPDGDPAEPTPDDPRPAGDGGDGSGEGGGSSGSRDPGSYAGSGSSGSSGGSGGGGGDPRPY